MIMFLFRLYFISVQNFKSQLVKRVQSVHSENQTDNEDSSETSHKRHRTSSQHIVTDRCAQLPYTISIISIDLLTRCFSDPLDLLSLSFQTLVFELLYSC